MDVKGACGKQLGGLGSLVKLMQRARPIKCQAEWVSPRFRIPQWDIQVNRPFDSVCRWLNCGCCMSLFRLPGSLQQNTVFPCIDSPETLWTKAHFRLTMTEEREWSYRRAVAVRPSTRHLRSCADRRYDKCRCSRTLHNGNGKLRYSWVVDFDTTI